MSLDWGGTDDALIRNLERYKNAVLDALHKLAQYLVILLEGYAKENASWTDRTSNARQSLAAYIDDQVPSTFSADEAIAYVGEKLADEMVAIYLSHGMSYGIDLETRFAGRYAIIWPTIEEHLPEIESLLKGIFKR